MSNYFVTSGGCTGFWLVVDTVPELTATINDAVLPNGATCDVAELHDSYQLDQACTIAADGLLYVATMSGVGRWVRRCLPSLEWSAQANWWINGTTGSDRASGAGAGTPIKTHAELVRRTGRLLGEGCASYTVRLAGAGFGGIDWTAIRAKHWPTLTYLGARTVLYSGSVTARTLYAVPPAAPARGDMTDAAIPVSWTASGLLGKLFIGTAGTIAGRLGWIEKDLGAKTAGYNPPVHPGTYAFGDVTVADTFDVVELLPCGPLICPEGCTIWLYDLAFDGTASPTWDVLRVTSESNVIATGCSFENGAAAVLGGSYFDAMACRFASSSSVVIRMAGVFILDGSTLECTARADPGATLEVYEAVTTWGRPAMAYAGQGPLQLFAGGWWGVFDMPLGSHGFQLSDEIAASAYIAGAFWGLFNAGTFGLYVCSGNVLRVAAWNLLGYGPNATNDWYCAASTGLYAALPSAPANTLAGIVLAT